MAIDTDWFVRRIQESEHGSLRRLAAKMRNRQGEPMNIAPVSLMLRGKREIVLSEARQLADLLGVPMGEVIKRAGVSFGVRDNVERR